MATMRAMDKLPKHVVAFASVVLFAALLGATAGPSLQAATPDAAAAHGIRQ